MPKNAAKYSSGDLAKIKSKIRAAMKRIGAEVGDKTESALVFASSSQQLDGQTPDSIVFMPKGEWEITPTVNGKSEAVNVIVDESTAVRLQESLAARLEDSIRPYAAFDHRPGPASFLPKGFKWDDDKGIMLEVDWTKAGKEAVSGRDYSYFSPTFLLNGKRVAGLPKDGEIGSLTNNPAFRKIQKIAASADDFEPELSMNKIAQELIELQVITAQQAETEDDDLLVKAIKGMHDALVMTQKANDLLQKENTDLQLKVQAVQETEADQVIRAAIDEGKIPPKDEDTVQFFKKQYLQYPEQTKKVLASLHGNSVLGKPIVEVKARDHAGARSWTQQDLIQAQKLAIAEIQETNPSLSFDTAFNKARQQHPELFVEA
jgi:phage I-like protein